MVWCILGVPPYYLKIVAALLDQRIENWFSLTLVQDVIGLFVAGGGEPKEEEKKEEAPAEAPAEAAPEEAPEGGKKKKKKKKAKA